MLGKWINGKPIYEVTVVSPDANAGTKTFNLSDKNIESDQSLSVHYNKSQLPSPHVTGIYTDEFEFFVYRKGKSGC